MTAERYWNSWNISNFYSECASRLFTVVSHTILLVHQISTWKVI